MDCQDISSCSGQFDVIGEESDATGSIMTFGSSARASPHTSSAMGSGTFFRHTHGLFFVF